MDNTDEIVRLLVNAEFLVEQGNFILAAQVAAQATAQLLEIATEGKS